MTNLKGKVAIVTGSWLGRGLEIACALSLAGAKVIIPSCTLEKSNFALEYITQQVPDADLIPMQLDLSSLASIQSFAYAFQSLHLPLHILINNASVVSCFKSYTKDEFEATFGINYLGHFYLTLLLADVLKKSAPARIVMVSSSANHLFLPSSGLDLCNLNAEKGYSPSIAYGQSKLASILFAKELQRQFDNEGADITVISLHPGMANSIDMPQHFDISRLLDSLCKHGSKDILKETLQSRRDRMDASSVIYCATSSGIIKGEFYCQNQVNANLLNKQANDQRMARMLWEASVKMIASKMYSIQ
ncbi:uncharacterized protein B0P05DRAFT_17333 [Gilbertella persicaria]|uniref:Uncharacterized protein n=1 Tax=Rhizopus stolonifer TaxID=4846 RepID=A0A367KXT9_RHIST|nr:uncharacterized protein B0P05DRAFT_17333 [Gilbertella persicaria]KAI8086961.1 hypothetical protein B0P05DRAFT_17333 [Gilbertella persicaria]RCI07028.1 hypothetical protein CU098_012940 [Rhizopus stolonifer]